MAQDAYLTDNTEALDISRQRILADLLTGQMFNQPQGQMISGHYVAPSWTQQLAPLASGIAGQAMGAKLDEKQLKLAEALRIKGDVAVEQIMETFNKNPKLAVKEAAQLQQYPQVKALLPTLVKELETPTSVREFNFAKENPEYMGYRSTISKAGAPNMTAITNVANYEPFKNKIQGGMGEGLVKQWETLKNIPVEIKNLDKAAELAPNSFAGTFAQQKTDIAKLFNNNLGTKIAVDKVNNTEELGSRLFQGTLENLKKMDASPSQYQQKVMQDAFGTITTDPTSIPKIIAVQKEILQQKAASHNLQVKQAETGPAKMEFPYSIYINQEPMQQPTTNGGWSIKSVK